MEQGEQAGSSGAAAKGRSLQEHGKESWREIEQKRRGRPGQRIRGSRDSCRLAARLCEREKDLHNFFLRRVRGPELAREDKGKDTNSPRLVQRK